MMFVLGACVTTIRASLRLRRCIFCGAAFRYFEYSLPDPEAVIVPDDCDDQHRRLAGERTHWSRAGFAHHR